MQKYKTCLSRGGIPDFGLTWKESGGRYSEVTVDKDRTQNGRRFGMVGESEVGWERTGLRRPESGSIV